jgi:predicted small secreted protein
MRQILILCCLMTSITACNTVQGVGQDLTYVGESMTEFSRDVRGEGQPSQTTSQSSGQQRY